LTAFLFGFFFGAIVIPCNPGFIAAFFARALLVDNVVSSMSNFLFFGIGLSFPLLVFSVISGAKSQLRIGWCSFYDAGVYCAVTGYCDWLLVLVEG
jgi:cytochrome c-type biogenesis protein